MTKYGINYDQQEPQIDFKSVFPHMYRKFAKIKMVNLKAKVMQSISWDNQNSNCCYNFKHLIKNQKHSNFSVPSSQSSANENTTSTRKYLKLLHLVWEPQ